MYIKLFIALASVSLHAGTFQPTKTNIVLKIPYNFGTHTATADKVSGSLQWDEKSAKITGGKLSLDAKDIFVDDKKLKCHLLESLTLDYKKSKFPEEHVCEENELPKEGDDASVYPTISVSLITPVAFDEDKAKVEWEIHGVKHVQTIPIKLNLSEDKKKLTLKSQWVMKRSDFGIIVKKFLFIDADDKLPVDLMLEGELGP